MAQLRELFEAKFSEALKTAGKQMEFHEFFTERLENEEAIRLRTEDMNRAVQEREYTVRKEKERLEQEAVQEGEEARVITAKAGAKKAEAEVEQIKGDARFKVMPDLHRQK
jgi:hypothetical protein